MYTTVTARSERVKSKHFILNTNKTNHTPGYVLFIVFILILYNVHIFNGFNLKNVNKFDWFRSYDFILLTPCIISDVIFDENYL